VSELGFTLRAEILCVGSELLLGQIIDTNAAYIGTQLARAGIDLHRKQTVGDNLDRITDCVRGSLARADVLVITGGLGPTTDDLTREAIAGATGGELEFKEELAQGLRDFFAKRGVEPRESTFRQAYLPTGATAIPNPVGTAPGVRWENDGKMIFAIPGVPREMKAMLDQTIIPSLLEKAEGQRQIIVSRLLRSFAVGESSLADPVEDILNTATNPTVAPLIFGNTEVHLRLTAKAPDETAARKLLDEMEAKLRERVGQHIFGVDDDTVPSVTLRVLESQGATLAVAESLTGGVLSDFLTEVPGASKVFLGGVIAYHADIKRDILGVPSETIDQYTVVSAEVAAAMAEGVRKLTGATYGLATTGEAGPNPATGAKVGKMFIGLAGPNGTQTQEREFFGDRDAVRRRGSLTAIDWLRQTASGSSAAPKPATA
jgi:nicotinamide-nucleotide amidase